jgi:hypothetical protein
LLADSNDQLNADWNRLPPLGCLNSSWIDGYRSALVLDTAGNPHIGHDVEHLSDSGEDYRTVRLVYSAGSTPPGPSGFTCPLQGNRSATAIS